MEKNESYIRLYIMMWGVMFSFILFTSVGNTFLLISWHMHCNYDKLVSCIIFFLQQKKIRVNSEKCDKRNLCTDFLIEEKYVTAPQVYQSYTNECENTIPVVNRLIIHNKSIRRWRKSDWSNYAWSCIFPRHLYFREFYDFYQNCFCSC